MPKMKTNSGAKKRFKVTGTGIKLENMGNDNLIVTQSGKINYGLITITQLVVKY